MGEHKDDYCEHDECKYWKQKWNCHPVTKNICLKETGGTNINWVSTSYTGPTATRSNEWVTKLQERKHHSISNIPLSLNIYEHLKKNFKNRTEEITKTGGWRYDMEFLLHLTRAFRFSEETGGIHKVKFYRNI